MTSRLGSRCRDLQTADSAAKRLAYSPGLDGLRAVACLAVMLYHAGLFHVKAGYLGVPVFFTLSGFLITSLLREELRGTGQIDLRAFWRRRVFRIIPLLAAVTAALALWGALDGSTVGRLTILGASATYLFVTNLVMNAHPGRAGALGANWSVAMEEQFYLFWPPLLAWLYRRVRSERLIAGGMVVLAVAIAAHRWMVAAQPGRSHDFYGPDLQADAILVGCAVALGLRCRSRRIGSTAILVIVGMFFVGGTSGLVAGRVALPIITIATALALPSLQEGPGWLGSRPLVWVGKRSYGLYLWGSALMHVARGRYGVEHPVLIVAVVAAVFAVNEITYRAIEVPMRRRGSHPSIVPAGRVAP